MRFVRVEGTPYQRGALMGEAFADAITRSVAFNRRYLAARSVDRDALEQLLQPYVDAATAELPHLVEQVRGMADGAGQSFEDLFFANAFEEVYGVLERAPGGVAIDRCTDVALASSGRTLLGHNEQWYAGDDGTVGMVMDVPADGPAVLAPVVAGTLPLVGMNEYGAAFGTMSLSGTDERVGVPRSLVARDLLESRDREDAVRRATLAGRAGGYSYLCAFPGGDVCAIESTATTAAVLDLAVHTNHALDPDVATASDAPSDNSRSRLARARTLAGTAEVSVAGMRALLADHGADGQDICVHPDPAEGDEGATVLFAMICEPETRTMWVAPGHPCTAALERYAFDDPPAPAGWAP